MFVSAKKKGILVDWLNLEDHKIDGKLTVPRREVPVPYWKYLKLCRRFGFVDLVLEESWICPEKKRFFFVFF